MRNFSAWTLWTVWTACLMLFVQEASVGEEKPILRVMQHISMNADVELVMYGDPDSDPEALVGVGWRECSSRRAREVAAASEIEGIGVGGLRFPGAVIALPARVE